jgi:hypothetical protein
LPFTFNVRKHLTFIGEYFGCCTCVITGVDPGFHSFPLHHINLKSDFVSGQVVIGVRPTLPVEDISLLFGIDMAGDKVNDRLLHSDGDISHYFIDKEHKFCVDTDED